MTAWELIKALEEGEKIRRKQWDAYTYLNLDDEKMLTGRRLDPFSLSDSGYYTDIMVRPEEYEIYNEPRWEDNIPECGVPCFAPSGEPVVVIRYDKEKIMPYRVAADDGWMNATPLTKSQIEEWIKNAPEE